MGEKVEGVIGSGTLRMLADCRDNGFAEPEWQVKGNTTTLHFPGLSPLSHRNEGVNEGVSEGVKFPAFEGVNEGVKAELLRLFQIIQNEPGLRVQVLSGKMQKSIATTERYLKLLREKDSIEFRGAPKTGGYFVKETS